MFFVLVIFHHADKGNRLFAGSEQIVGKHVLCIGKRIGMNKFSVQRRIQRRYVAHLYQFFLGAADGFVRFDVIAFVRAKHDGSYKKNDETRAGSLQCVKQPIPVVFCCFYLISHKSSKSLFCSN